MECNKNKTIIKYEQDLWDQGYSFICGIDEVGRGCIAGPLVACAVILPKNYINHEIKDSKLLSANQRFRLANEIKQVALAYCIEVIEPDEVDKLNPKQASRLAMQRCVESLQVKPDYVLIDFETIELDIKHLSLVKGDQKSQSIAASSILAKAYRDQYMLTIANNYDKQYDLANNKGYLTKKHYQALKTLGPIKGLHRFSYKPIKTSE